jgi:hypothetical protein
LPLIAREVGFGGCRCRGRARPVRFQER